MPSFTPVSSTVIQTPPALATLVKYRNTTLIPQGFQDNPFSGLLFGDPPGDTGAGDRPKFPLSMGRRPKREVTSGPQVEEILNFETGNNVQTYRGLQELSTGIYQGGTKIFSPWAQYTTFVAIARDQKMHNAGAFKEYDLLKSQMEQNTREMMERLEADAISTNTDVVEGSQDEIVGVQHWNSATPTSTCHGLSRTTYTPFRNQTATSSSFAANGIDTMDAMMDTIAGTNGGRFPDVGITTSTVHGYYRKQSTAIHRIVGDIDSPDLGVKGTPMFRGMPLVWVPNWGSGRIDFLSTANLKPYIEQGSNWANQSYQPPPDLAVEGMARWFFHCALLHTRHETNGLVTVSAA